MKRFLILFLLMETLCFSQQEKFKQLDFYLDQLFSKNKFMGTVVVSKNGQVIYGKSIGYANIINGKKNPIGKESKFRIASITKSYTATMIFQLIDEGKLQLTDKLSKYFPQIPNAETITIENLLDHSSGIFNITSDNNFLNWYLKETSQVEMLARMQKHPAVFQPNKKNEYSNSNFILLGYIIEKIDHSNYAEALNKRITTKIGLRNTYFGAKINAKNDECFSYYYKDGALNLAPETNMSNPAGAGGIVATPYDLIVFYEALFTGKLISPESLTKMTSTKSAIYGSGIFVGEIDGQKSFGHGGSIDGFKSEISYKPKEKMTLVVIANALNYPLTNIINNAFLASQNKGIQQDKLYQKTLLLTLEQIQPYAGIYEGFMGSEKTPYTFTFKAVGKVLKGGPNASDLYELRAVDKDEFVIEQFGIHLKFDPGKSTLIFSQAGIDPQTLTKKL